MKKLISILAALLCCILGATTAQAAIEQPTQYLQYDERWGHKVYSSINDNLQTIGNSGCGPTAMAMVLDYYINDAVTPDIMADYALSHYYVTPYQGTSWGLFSAIAKDYGLEFLQTSCQQDVLQWMQDKENGLVICSMTPGLWTVSGHFIVIWKIQNGWVYVNDPYSTDQEKTYNSFEYLAQQCKQYFCFNQKKQEQRDNKKLETLEEEKFLFPIVLKSPISYKASSFKTNFEANQNSNSLLWFVKLL